MPRTGSETAVAAIPAAVNALSEILNLIATLKAEAGYTDEQLQSIVDAKIDQNRRDLLALLAR